VRLIGEQWYEIKRIQRTISIERIPENQPFEPAFHPRGSCPGRRWLVRARGPASRGANFPFDVDDFDVDDVDVDDDDVDALDETPWRLSGPLGFRERCRNSGQRPTGSCCRPH